MSDHSKIEWTDATWNPVRGCSRVSEGCRNCYAERLAARFSGPGLWAEGLAENTPGGPRWTGRVELVPDKLDQPLRWTRPRRVFVNSMSDLFHEGLSNEAVAAVFGVMAAAPRHTFQVLTKRPERMRHWLRVWLLKFAMEQRDIASAPSLRQTCMKAAFTAMGETDRARRLLDPQWHGDHDGGPWPLPNVWLGVSVEDQATADERIPLLLDTPAAVRFVSAEPLLGPLDLSPWLMARDERDRRQGAAYWAFTRSARAKPPSLADPAVYAPSLDWVITGGESGPGARPAHPQWFRDIRDACEAAGVAHFHKQNGEWAPLWDAYIEDLRNHPVVKLDGETLCRYGKHDAGRLLDGREHDAFPGGAP